jgi:hypothetical protein
VYRPAYPDFNQQVEYEDDSFDEYGTAYPPDEEDYDEGEGEEEYDYEEEEDVEEHDGEEEKVEDEDDNDFVSHLSFSQPLKVSKIPRELFH